MNNETITKIVSEVEVECCLASNTLYYDIVLFNRLFGRNYDRCCYVVFGDDEMKVEHKEKVPIEYHYKTAGKTSRGMFVAEDKDKQQYITVESMKKVFGKNLYRFAYSNYITVFETTVVTFKEYKIGDEKTVFIDTILTCDDDETILSHFEGIENAGDDEKTWSVAIDAGNYIATRMNKLPDYNIDVEANYNDDIPVKEVKEILESENPGLILFYGAPGGGKTSFIKYLMKECDANFIFADSSVINSSSSSRLIDFLDSNKNSVIVLEDCEKLLVSRDTEGNGKIGTLLNLTDGLIGDLMGIKFICTFNCALSKLDDALLRKGRLSLKYEFKELSYEKAKAICPSATGPMLLSDIFNQEKNDFSIENKKKIGFEE